MPNIVDFKTAASSFATSIDVIGLDFGTNPNRGIILWVWTNGYFTAPDGTQVASVAIDPAGANIAVTGSGPSRVSTSSSGVGGNGRLQMWYLASSSIPTGVKNIRVTAADGNAPLNVWAMSIDDVTVLSAPSYSEAYSAAPSLTIASASGAKVFGFVGEYAIPDAWTFTPSSPATQYRRINSTDMPYLQGVVWQEAGAASVTLDGTASNTYFWVMEGISATPGGGGGTAPTINTQPTNQTVAEGATATFSVAATGSGTLTYQWQRQPAAGGGYTNISGATAASFTTPVTTYSGGSASNGDTYRCVVTGDTAPPATSNAATLTVTAAAPSITSQPSNQTVTAGATASFSVTATGSGTLTYQWQRNPGGNTSFANISGATSSSYTTPATTVTGGSANNGDTYRCVVTNPGGSTNSNSATLTVSAAGTAPSITAQPSNRTVTAGSTATFSVTASGSGTLTYQWQRNPGGNTSFSNISGATSSSYTTPVTTVTGGTANNGDTYRVVVTGDTAPPATSNPATLVVNAVTSVSTEPLENFSGSLAVSSLCNYSWYPNGRIGSLSGITPIEGTATTDGAGVLTVTGLPAGSGILLTCVRGASAALDAIQYQALTVV